MTALPPSAATLEDREHRIRRQADELDALRRKYATVCEERDVLRAKLRAAEARLEERRGAVVGALTAALRMTRAT